MPKLIKIVNGVAVHEYPLERGVLYIGRAPENEIQLDDSAVSSRHARVRVEASVYMEGCDDVWLEDSDSTNGTLLNDRRITRARLRNGDVIRIGTHRLEFVDEANLGAETTRLLLTDTLD